MHFFLGELGFIITSLDRMHTKRESVSSAPVRHDWLPDMVLCSPPRELQLNRLTLRSGLRQTA